MSQFEARQRLWETMLLHFHVQLDPADVRARQRHAKRISRLLDGAATVEEKGRLLREKPWRSNPEMLSDYLTEEE